MNATARIASPITTSPKSSHSSVTRMNSDRGYDVAEEGGASSSGGESSSLAKSSFNSISRLENTLDNSSNDSDNSKYRGTDVRFSVTPMNVNKL